MVFDNPLPSAAAGGGAVFLVVDKLDERVVQGLPVRQDKRVAGQEIAQTRDDIGEICASWGHVLNLFGFDKQSVGLSLRLVSGSGLFDYFDIPKYGFLCDLGYNLKFPNHFDFALVANNLGVPLKGLEYDIGGLEDTSGTLRSYTKTAAKKDRYLLTPPQISGAIGFSYEKDLHETRLLDIHAEGEVRKDFLTDAPALSDNLFVAFGGQCVFFRTGQLRIGIRYDAGTREWEYSTGLGLSFFNHVGLQSFYILPVLDNPYRKGQFGFGVQLNNMLKWSASDRIWMHNASDK
jgi:hypothetical protein